MAVRRESWMISQRWGLDRSSRGHSFFVAKCQRNPVIESTCQRVANPEKNPWTLSRNPRGESMDNTQLGREDEALNRKAKRDRDCR